ncbi:MAG: BLUF domain-containing protein [Bacteriovoracaceae bacterium]
MELLDKSRKNNDKIGVTGMLIYQSSIFLQLLEGDRESVQKLFNKIKADKRHDQVIILYEGQTEERLFPHWTMAYKKIDEIKPELLAEVMFLADDSLKDKRMTKPEAVLKTLRKFRLSM